MSFKETLNKNLNFVWLLFGLINTVDVNAATFASWEITGKTYSSPPHDWSFTGVAPNSYQNIVSKNFLAAAPDNSEYKAVFTVDLTHPKMSNSVANFQGAIKYFGIYFPSTGYSYSSVSNSNQGVSITPKNPGDVIYFYMPFTYGDGLLSNFFFIDPIGSLHLSNNLQDLFDSFELSKYSIALGQASLYSPSCLYNDCGRLQFSVDKVTVYEGFAPSVPESSYDLYSNIPVTTPIPAAGWLFFTAITAWATIRKKFKHNTLQNA